MPTWPKPLLANSSSTLSRYSAKREQRSGIGMEAAPRFATQVAGGDHFLEQRRRAIFAVVEAVVERFENRQHGVQANQIRQGQRANRLVATQAHASVDVVGAGQTFLKHQDRFVD